MSTKARDLQCTYPMGLEDSTELARVVYRDRFLTRYLGGVLPEQSDLSNITSVLDVGCGSGGWLLDVAHDYPKVDAIGIDLSQMMIDYAYTSAFGQGLENASFVVMDALEPLDFSDQCFDIVNARFIACFMRKDAWPRFLKECLRITRPGGIIRITEWERPLTNSLAVEKLYDMFMCAIKQNGLGFSPDGRHVCVVSELFHLLRDAGYEDIRANSYELDLSAGTENHEFGYHDFMVAYQLLQPYLVTMKQGTQNEVEALYQQALPEIMANSYCSLIYFRTVWGKKPVPT